jgi:hypothetical protein
MTSQIDAQVITAISELSAKYMFDPKEAAEYLLNSSVVGGGSFAPKLAPKRKRLIVREDSSDDSARDECLAREEMKIVKPAPKKRRTKQQIAEDNQREMLERSERHEMSGEDNMKELKSARILAEKTDAREARLKAIREIELVKILKREEKELAKNLKREEKEEAHRRLILKREESVLARSTRLEIRLADARIREAEKEKRKVEIATRKAEKDLQALLSSFGRISMRDVSRAPVPRAEPIQHERSGPAQPDDE